MSRRAAARSVAAALRAARRSPGPAGLADCVVCGRDFVIPVTWEAVGSDRWWIRVRCAECGTSREVTVSNAEAERYDDELADGMRTLMREARKLELARMAAEADVFAAALERDLIGPADFAR
jgi:hypothetical protein